MYMGGISLGLAAQTAQAASVDAARAGAKALNSQEAFRSVEERMDKLILLNMAMWELIKERTNLTEEDLMQRVADIDLRDGKADGKITHTIKRCGKCGRTMSPRHNRCLYCGAMDLSVGAFETI